MNKGAKMDYKSFEDWGMTDLADKYGKKIDEDRFKIKVKSRVRAFTK